MSKFWFVDCEGSGSPPALPSFEQKNTKLPSEMSPSPYFKTPSRNMLLVEHITDEQQHHLYEHIPFGFKEPLILENVIMLSDNNISHNNPTSYFYWCSHLNRTTHIARSSNHFLYSVTLDTKGQMISRLSTRALLTEPQPFLTKIVTLYYFRSLFSITAQMRCKSHPYG